MRAIDIDVLRRHLEGIEDAVSHLHNYSGLTVEDLVSDRERLWALERGLEICIQNVLDICVHLNMGLGLKSPGSYRESILSLASAGVLSLEFAERIAPMAALRNILVHQYMTVDPRRLHGALVQGLSDFSEFTREVQAFLAQDPRTHK